MHALRRLIEMADEELRHDVRGAAGVLDFWGRASSEEARLRAFDGSAAMLEQARARERFEPLDLPEGRCPPDGEVVLAWAMHRSGAALADFPECARVDGDTTTLGATGGSETCTVYRGPLSLRGRVRVSGTVVVVGDLSVEGVLDGGSAAESALAVIGALRVRSLVARGDLLVTGALWGDVVFVETEEASLAVGGRLEAKVLVADYWSVGDGHPFVVKTAELEAVRERLDPRPDGDIDAWELAKKVGAGTWRVR